MKASPGRPRWGGGGGGGGPGRGGPCARPGRPPRLGDERGPFLGELARPGGDGRWRRSVWWLDPGTRSDRGEVGGLAGLPWRPGSAEVTRLARQRPMIVNTGVTGARLMAGHYWRRRQATQELWHPWMSDRRRLAARTRWACGHSGRPRRRPNPPHGGAAGTGTGPGLPPGRVDGTAAIWRWRERAMSHGSPSMMPFLHRTGVGRA